MADHDSRTPIGAARPAQPAGHQQSAATGRSVFAAKSHIALIWSVQTRYALTP